jgi:hypothetical protein
MSKVIPSALRGLSVAAGTVGLAAVGAAVAAGQACAAESGPSLAGGGLPVSTNAVPAVMGAVAHNHGTIAGIPLSGLPFLGQLPGMMDNASPASDALPGLGYADLGELPVTRSRPLPGAAPHGVRTTHVAQHAAVAHAAPVAAPAPAKPAVAPAAQAPVRTVTPAPAAQNNPLDGVTNALHGLPIAGQLAGPGQSLPVVGGLADGLPLSGLGGLTGGLEGIGG